MNKYLSIFMLIVSGCATTKPAIHKPLFEEGACYSIDLYGTNEGGPFDGSLIHKITEFQIHKIVDFKGRPHYEISMLTWDLKKGLGVEFPKRYKLQSYGYTTVEEFDKYLGPIATQFYYPYKPELCAALPDSNSEKPRPPLMRVGNDLDGWAGIKKGK